MDNIIWIDSLEVGTGQSLGKGGQYNLDGLTGGGHWALGTGHWALGTGQ